MACYKHQALATVISGLTMKDAIGLTEYFAGQARELVNGAVADRDPYKVALRQIMEHLHKTGETGPTLNHVRDLLNDRLPLSLQMDSGGNKRLASILREMGMQVEVGTGNKSRVYGNC